MHCTWTYWQNVNNSDEAIDNDNDDDDDDDKANYNDDDDASDVNYDDDGVAIYMQIYILLKEGS